MDGNYNVLQHFYTYNGPDLLSSVRFVPPHQMDSQLNIMPFLPKLYPQQETISEYSEEAQSFLGIGVGHFSSVKRLFDQPNNANFGMCASWAQQLADISKHFPCPNITISNSSSSILSSPSTLSNQLNSFCSNSPNESLQVPAEDSHRESDCTSTVFE